MHSQQGWGPVNCKMGCEGCRHARGRCSNIDLSCPFNFFAGPMFSKGILEGKQPGAPRQVTRYESARNARTLLLRFFMVDHGIPRNRLGHPLCSCWQVTNSCRCSFRPGFGEHHWRRTGSWRWKQQEKKDLGAHLTILQDRMWSSCPLEEQQL